jgi:hypothetical protein
MIASGVYTRAPILHGREQPVNLADLLAWQWEGYPRFHRSRANLLMHIVLVPLFLAGNLALIWALLDGSWRVMGLGAAAMVLSISLQGRGHAAEPVPPIPFSGPGNAVARIFLEQWITFPRFVFTGGWWRNLRS